MLDQSFDYAEMCGEEFVQQLVAQLPWNRDVQLRGKLETFQKQQHYLKPLLKKDN